MTIGATIASLIIAYLLFVPALLILGAAVIFLIVSLSMHVKSIAIILLLFAATLLVTGGGLAWYKVSRDKKAHPEQIKIPVHIKTATENKLKQKQS